MRTLSLSDYEDVKISMPYGHMAGRWYGSRAERPILAIHGWQDNLGTFNTLIPLLPDYVSVLCIDLPGHGHSGRLPPGMHYSTEDWVLVIVRTMKEFRWTKISLMGHSMGGVLCYLFTALAPHLVDLVIVLDGFLPHMESTYQLDIMPFRIDKYFVEEGRARETLVQEPPAHTKAQLASVLAKATNQSVPTEFADHLLQRNLIKSELYPDKYYISKDGRTKVYKFLAMPLDLSCEMVKGLKTNPLLVIKATNSPFIYPESSAAFQILAEENPNYEYYEVSGGHHVHLTNPKICAQYIVPFLKRYRPRVMSDERILREKNQSKL